MNLIKAQMLLMKCNGDEIWSVDVCRREGVPESWIAELANPFESGFDTDENSIYVNDQLTNQYYGVPDLRLAYKLAAVLGVDCQTATALSLSRLAEVQALQEAAEEL